MIRTTVIILCDGNVKWKFGICRIFINLVTFKNPIYHVLNLSTNADSITITMKFFQVYFIHLFKFFRGGWTIFLEGGPKKYFRVLFFFCGQRMDIQWDFLQCTVWKTIEEIALRVCQPFRGLFNFSLSFTFILNI